jgi:hypothetical protein
LGLDDMSEWNNYFSDASSMNTAKKKNYFAMSVPFFLLVSHSAMINMIGDLSKY